MKTAKDFKVGQSIWFESAVRWLNSDDSTIAKVGRKYVTLANKGVFEPEVSNVVRRDGFTIGHVFADKAARLVDVERQNAWRDLREFFRVLGYGAVPSHLTTDQMREMLATLKGGNEH